MRSRVLPARDGSAKAHVRRYAKHAASYGGGRRSSLLKLFRKGLAPPPGRGGGEILHGLALRGQGVLVALDA